MNAIITYFSDLEKRPLERAGFFIAGMVLLWAVEHLVPLIHNHYKKTKVRHAGTNLAFTAIHFVIHTLLAGGIIVIAGYTSSNGFGLVNWIGGSALITILITCLTLDFLQDGSVILLNTKLVCSGVSILFTTPITM